MDQDLYSGFTLAGATTALGAVFGSGMYAKLHVGFPFDGTMNPSVITARQAITFTGPDSNGAYSLSTPVSWSGITTVEDLWGISLWTSSTAGSCRFVNQFTDAKYVFNGDTFVLVSMSVALPVVGQ